MMCYVDHYLSFFVIVLSVLGVTASENPFAPLSRGNRKFTHNKWYIGG